MFIKKIFILIVIGSLLLPINSEPQNKTLKQPERTESFLVVPRLKIRKEIKDNLSWLDDNFVCTLNPLSLGHGTVLLFGHNHHDVFHFLYQLQSGDEIYLEYGNHMEHYQVVSKKIISVTSKNYLDITSEKEVRMFTCTRNNNTRLLVIAK